jgi:hypothetical protein
MNFCALEKEEYLAKGGRNKDDEMEEKIIIIKEPVLHYVVL